MAYEKPKIEFIRDNVVRVLHPVPVGPVTHLTASVAATGTALTVRNNMGFANGDLILYEGYGNESAEIKKVNAAVTAGTSLTSTAVTFAHSIDCSLVKVLWNRMEISGAATPTGSKTSIATVDMDVSANHTDYIVTGTTYPYYFVRYYNSIDDTYSSYSDYLASTDYAPNTVGYVVSAAFENLNEPVSDKYPVRWLLEQVYQCELDVLRSKQHWSSMVELDYDAGDLATGDSRFALPSDIDETQGRKAILSVRIGNRTNMEYIDNADFNSLMEDVARTTLASTAAVGAVTLVLTDSGDFDDSGTVSIGGTDYAYTANDRSTNTLSGLTALTAQVDAGKDVWQNIDSGEPRRYAVIDGYVYFDCPVDSEWNGRNIYIDYFRHATRYMSYGDTLALNDVGLYIHWLEAQIKRRKSGGDLNPVDFSWSEYTRRKGQYMMLDRTMYGVRITPAVPDAPNRFPSWWPRR
jgi:hypothetical protein